MVVEFKIGDTIYRVGEMVQQAGDMCSSTGKQKLLRFLTKTKNKGYICMFNFFLLLENIGIMV